MYNYKLSINNNNSTTKAKAMFSGKSHVWNTPDLIQFDGIINNMVKEIKCMLTKLLCENI